MRGLLGEKGPQFSVAFLAAAMVVSITDEGRAQQSACAATAQAVEYPDQGWTVHDRGIFYTTSQGSHLMPYAWFKALRRADGVDAPFAADQLQRYGYLCNESPDNTYSLPIGFVVDSKVTPPSVGLTCAACHTGQIEYQKDGATHVIRIDGAPAKADTEQFVIDLLAASRATLNDSVRLAAFVNAAIGAGYPAANIQADFQHWVARFGDFLDHSLPALSSPSWGPGRIDAFGMIFNRVTAFDLGIPANYRRADAPVKYPFLWNASRQDHTQWNGNTPNGVPILGLARNIGEVLGVFGDFEPKKALFHIDFSRNSIDFHGLRTLEEEIETLKPPPWPFTVDKQTAEEGKPLYDKWCATKCHEKKRSPSLGLFRAWATPRLAVGTDPKMASNAQRDAPDPGLFAGHLRPPPAFLQTFANPAKAHELLVASVIGIVLDGATYDLIAPSVFERSGARVESRQHLSLPRPGDLKDGRSLLLQEDVKRLVYERLPPAAGAAYEARVLCGIWAVAPYLHNGSVPNLWELLTPPKDRQSRFMVGSRVYDANKVGYATDKSPFSNGTFVTDPQNANGNGNAGHDFGTALSNHEKVAIIEYIKTLDASSQSCSPLL